MKPEPARAPRRPLVLGLLRAAAILWALAWTVFVVAVAAGEPWQGRLLGVGLAAAVWAPALLALRWPVLAGAAAIALGVTAALVMDSRTSMLALTLPAIGLGVGLIVTGLAAMRRRARARRHAADPDAQRPAEES